MILDLSGLQALTERAVAAGRVAVDTEFIREKTYFPELALIQLAVDDVVGLVDPIGPNAPALLEAVAALLSDPRVIKIIHAAPQDLEVLRVAIGVVPEPLYDTQIAAALVGLGGPERQVSYATLVSETMNVTLSKVSQRADWLARPIAPALLDYAADDVRWLGPMYRYLNNRFDRGLAEEHAAKCAELVATARKGLDAEALADRVKGASRLKGPARTRLVALARWREERAQHANVPRRWLLTDEVLVALAYRAPKNADALYAISELPSRARSRWGNELLALVNGAPGAPGSHR